MSSICNVRAFIVYWVIRQEEAAGMQEIKVPIGRSGFADIRKNGYYYIDKSGLIRELLRTDGRQVTLITRPRRFGKTLGMSMLSEFFTFRRTARIYSPDSLL